MKKIHIELIALVLLFISAFWLWSLPYQKNLVPYGDVDSSTHFTLADYMALNDYPTYWLPYYMGYLTEGGGKLWYPPQYHTASAMLNIFTGERILPVLLFQTICCFSIIFTSYFLIRKLYGTLPAFLTALLLVFSTRDIMWYLWGQYPQVLSFGIVPLVLYCFYIYITEKKKTYIYLASVFVSVQFFIHPQSIFISFVTCAFFSLFYMIKERKFPFRIQHIIFSLIIICLLIIPFYSFPFGKKAGYSDVLGAKIDTTRLNTLFHWYGILEPIGVPKDYYSFSKMIGLWLLPLFIIGLFFIISRRKNNDLLMLSWLIAFYLAAHDTVFGLWRAERFTEVEMHIIGPIAVIGLFSVVSCLKLKKEYKTYIKYGLVILFIVFAFSFNGRTAYSSLKDAYGGLLRLTPYQYEVSEWMRENLPENANVYEIGTAVPSKKKWIRALSLKKAIWDFTSITPEQNESVGTHVLIDYSDVFLINDRANIEALQKWENENLKDQKLIYDKNYAKVYEIAEE